MQRTPRDRAQDGVHLQWDRGPLWSRRRHRPADSRSPQGLPFRRQWPVRSLPHPSRKPVLIFPPVSQSSLFSFCSITRAQRPLHRQSRMEPSCSPFHLARIYMTNSKLSSGASLSCLSRIAVRIFSRSLKAPRYPTMGKYWWPTRSYMGKPIRTRGMSSSRAIYFT